MRRSLLELEDVTGCEKSMFDPESDRDKVDVWILLLTSPLVAQVSIATRAFFVLNSSYYI